MRPPLDHALASMNPGMLTPPSVFLLGPVSALLQGARGVPALEILAHRMVWSFFF